MLIDRLGHWRRRVEWMFSRNEWFIRFFHLPSSTGTAAEPGLVLIQIDGLPRTQLERAVAKGRMPFLRRLMRRERAVLHTLYSGQPSTTPAVQGELFYGRKTAVPAFSFRDSKAGRIVRMFDSDIASRVEAELAQEGQPLLAGGSAYSDIYGGGASDANFCAVTFGWGEAWKKLNPLAIVSLLLSHFGSVLRVAALMALELVIAIGDLIGGKFPRSQVWAEIKYIPSRVMVSVLLPGPARGEDTVAALARAIHGFTTADGTFVGGLPETAKWDNGREFINENVTATCLRLNISPYPSAPYSPWQKGKVERWHETIQTELFSLLPGASEGPRTFSGRQPWRGSDEHLLSFAALAVHIDDWLVHYNTERPHRGYRNMGRRPIDTVNLFQETVKRDG